MSIVPHHYHFILFRISTVMGEGFQIVHFDLKSENDLPVPFHP
jgi:hypothetical protein